MQISAEYHDCTHRLAVQPRNEITGQMFAQSAKVDEYLTLDNKSIPQTMVEELVESVKKAAHPPILPTPHVATPPGLMSAVDLMALYGIDYGSSEVTMSATDYTTITTGPTLTGMTLYTTTTTTGTPMTWSGTSVAHDPQYAWAGIPGSIGAPALAYPVSPYTLIELSVEGIKHVAAKRKAKRKTLPALKPATRKLILL